VVVAVISSVASSLPFASVNVSVSPAAKFAVESSVVPAVPVTASVAVPVVAVARSDRFKPVDRDESV